MYFNGYDIPFAQCSDKFSAIIQPRPAIDLNNLGVIDILQCSTALTTAIEGIYTCVMVNSSMMHESVRLGVYLIGRSELIT